MNWGDCVSDAASDVGMSVVQTIVDSCCAMAGKVAAAVTTWWISVPTANILADSQGNGPIVWVWQHTMWLSAWIAVMAILVSAGRLAIQRRAEPAIDVAKGIFAMSFVGAGALAAVGVLTTAGDDFSEWIVYKAADGDFGAAVIEWLKVSAQSQGGPMLALILALLATLACLAQVALMLVRTAMLILLCGTLPLTAAAATTPSGRQTFQKAVSWLIAFVMYKPVAAIIYATAFRMIAALKTSKGTDGLVTSVSGIVLMLLSVVALPALMRFVTPVVGAAGGGGGGGGGVAAMGAIAGGAKAVSSQKSGAGGGGGGGGGRSRVGGPDSGSGSDPRGSKSVPSQGNPAQGAPKAGAQGAQGVSQGTQAAGKAGAAGAAKAHPVAAAAEVAQKTHSAIKQSTENTANAGQHNGGPSGSS
ncbi:hypothetical protein F7Q99_30705 [Streptomyces kaniharaensis]|uniref:Type IV secretion system protein n=1 Tax=Streptomyces kaniharaensis TaxID=212423 RepID=A0A6N7L0U1_9ACTN|nr:hypothetical protein [Streptomyces kaniharaensis]MQS16449.1 hypothetical protein [Streptomyces kaniharaensis]